MGILDALMSGQPQTMPYTEEGVEETMLPSVNNPQGIQSGDVIVEDRNPQPIQPAPSQPQQKEQPSWLDGLVNDDARMGRVLIALNSMRTRPDAGIQQMGLQMIKGVSDAKSAKKKEIAAKLLELEKHKNKMNVEKFKAMKQALIEEYKSEQTGIQKKKDRESSEKIARLNRESREGIAESKLGNPSVLAKIVRDKGYGSEADAILEDPANAKLVYEGVMNDIKAKTGTVPSGMELVSGQKGDFLRPYPGSKQALEIEQAQKAKEAVLTNQKTGTEVFNRSANKALDLIRNSPTSTGRIGALVRSMPDMVKATSDATQLQAHIDNMSANLGFDSLAQMKKESGNGASGLGQVTVIELQALQKRLGNLSDLLQKPKELEETIENIQGIYNEKMEILVREYGADTLAKYGIPIPGDSGSNLGDKLSKRFGGR